MNSSEPDQAREGMIKFHSPMQQHLSRLKPWVVLAALIAIGLLGYYILLGIQYKRASAEEAFLSDQVYRLSRLARAPLSLGSGQVHQLESQTRWLAELNSWFDYPRTGSPLTKLAAFPEPTTVDLKSRTSADHLLMDVLSTTAEEAQVKVVPVAGGELEEETRGELRFQVKPIDIVIEGYAANMYRFLNQLDQKPPLATVSILNIENLDFLPIAEIELRFYYLSPRGAQHTEGTE